LLVAAVALISDALNAATTPRDLRSARAGSAGNEAAPTTDPDAIAPTSSSSATTQRAQAQLDRLVRGDEPIDGIPLRTSDRLLPIETIFAPVALVGIDHLALTAAIERSAADWLPLESEITQLARANSGDFGGTAGGGFGGGGFGGGGFGGSALSDSALSDDASDDAFVGGSGGSGTVAALSALRGGDAGTAGASLAVDAIAFRPNGSDGVDSSLRASGSRRHGGDANHTGNGNGGSNGSNGGASHSPRGSGDGPREIVSVPEPSSLLLTALGVTFAARRLRRRAAR
jgi:hypothetical protein